MMKTVDGISGILVLCEFALVGTRDKNAAPEVKVKVKVDFYSASS